MGLQPCPRKTVANLKPRSAVNLVSTKNKLEVSTVVIRPFVEFKRELVEQSAALGNRLSNPVYFCRLCERVGSIPSFRFGRLIIVR